MSTSVRKWTVSLMLFACAPAFIRCARSTSANATSAPTVTSVSPTEGPLAGGTLITITGSGFTLTATVAIGGKACAEVVPLSSTSISCSTPSVTAAAAADVVVTNRNFTTGELASGTLAAGYTYQAAPTVVSATTGFFMGGSTITVTGTAFRTGATVTIGASACSSVSVASLTSLTCVNPAGTAASTATVTVTNTDGQAGSLAAGFTWRQVQFSTFLDGNGTQGLAKDQTKNASKALLVDLTTKLAAVWQESDGTATQIRAASFDGNITTPTLGSWDFFDNNAATGLNKDTAKNATDPSPAVLSSKLYLAWSEMGATNKQIRVRVNTGTLAAENWTFVEKAVPDATGLNINTALDADEPKAFVVNSLLYVAWRENDSSVDQVRVKEYNGNDGAPTWTARSPAAGLNHNTGFAAGAPTLGTNASKLYAMWSESDGANTIIRMKVYTGAGTVWNTTHTSAGFGNNCNQAVVRNTFTPKLLQFNSKLYATWIESNGANNQARVAVYDGDDAGTHSFACVDGGTLNKNSGSNSTNPRLAVLGSSLFAIWSEGATGQTRVKAYNGNDSSPSWTFVDGDLATGINKDTLRAATFPALLSFGSLFYSAWTETDGVTTSIRLRLGN